MQVFPARDAVLLSFELHQSLWLFGRSKNITTLIVNHQYLDDKNTNALNEWVNGWMNEFCHHITRCLLSNCRINAKAASSHCFVVFEAEKADFTFTITNIIMSIRTKTLYSKEHRHYNNDCHDVEDDDNILVTSPWRCHSNDAMMMVIMLLDEKVTCFLFHWFPAIIHHLSVAPIVVFRSFVFSAWCLNIFTFLFRFWGQMLTSHTWI